jgi:DnaA family protein
MTADIGIQLPLSVQLRDDATFDNFFPGGNAQVLFALRKLVKGTGEPFIYLWGQPGVGCSHLLQAACHEADGYGLSAVYLPMEELVSYSPEIFDGLEGLDLVCLDNVQAIAGQPHWEEGLFDLYNRLKDDEVRLVIAASSPPAKVGLKLPDLVSRLSWGLSYQIQSLTEPEKLHALQLRANQRGLDLHQDVGRYLLHRCDHSMNRLLVVLDTLDEASLTAQRKLTKPFIREVMDW